jgi:hypothetical protein
MRQALKIIISVLIVAAILWGGYLFKTDERSPWKTGSAHETASL